MIDLTGKTFGWLLVVGRCGTTPKRETIWTCRCVCGNPAMVRGSKLRNGRTRSCGCYKRENPNGKRHGENGTRLYHIWKNMKQRCSNSMREDYKYYGARGIVVCEQWTNSYEAFRDWARNNGYADELSIDRIDVNGGYSPMNCRWADMRTQQNNRTNNHFIIAEGERRTASEWVRKAGVTCGAILFAERRGVNMHIYAESRKTL